MSVSSPKELYIVFCTVPKHETGVEIAKKIVENRLAACVSIVSALTSIYYWQEKIIQDNEELLIIKTAKAKLKQLEKFIAENHPYEVPEIVALSADKVAKPYFAWLSDYLTPAKKIKK